MSRLRSRVLTAVGASSLVLTSLAIADTTAATSTTEPGAGAVGSTAVVSDANEAATTSTPGAVGPATRLEPLPAGTYVSETFMPPLTYTVPEGWKMFSDRLTEYVLYPADVAPPIPGIRLQGLTVYVWRDVEAAAPEFCASFPVEGLGYSAEKITAWLAGFEGLVTTQPAPVSVGGLDGFMIDVAMAPSWTEPCPPYFEEPVVWALYARGFSGLTATEAQRIYILDLPDGGNVALVIYACCDPVNGDLDSPEFHDAIATATPIVESFRFDVSDLVENTTVEVATTG